MAKKKTKKKDDDFKSFVSPEEKEKAVSDIKKEEKPAKTDSANARVKDDDEKRKKAVKLNGTFQMIKLSGEDRYRIVGKRGDWISPVGVIKELSKLEAKLNSKDEEQKLANIPSGAKGKWREAMPGESI